MQALIIISLEQQVQLRRNNDHNKQICLRLERNDRKKVSCESQLAGQTLEQRHLLHLVLIPLLVLDKTSVFECSDLIFSDLMKSLVEAKNPNNVLNQLQQITQDAECSPNKALFFQFLRTQGCLPFGGMAVGGLTVFMMIAGYSYESAKDFSLLHDINMRTSEEGSDADFRSLLGKANIVPPANKHKALLMFQGMQAFLVKMGEGPCTASLGYALAADLWKENSQEIHRLTRNSQEQHFLLRLLSAIDRENYLLYRTLFCDIQEAGDGPFRFCMNLVYKRDEEITQFFDGLLQDRTHVLKLPDNFLSLLASNQSRGRGCGSGGGGGGEEKPPTKRQQITQKDGVTKVTLDKWSTSSTVVNPMAKFFPTTGSGKANRDRWMKITFNHHQRMPGSDGISQTPLCLNYQVAGFCKLGQKCKHNHRSRRRMLEQGDAKMKKNIQLVDKIVDSLS